MSFTGFISSFSVLKDFTQQMINRTKALKTYFNLILSILVYLCLSYLIIILLIRPRLALTQD